MARITTGTLPVLAGLLTLGLVLPTIAQKAGEERTKEEKKGYDKTPDLNQAKEMAKLIEQGQANLRDAAMLAERHVNGTALAAKCEIKTGSMPEVGMTEKNPNMPDHPQNPGGPQDPDAQERGSEGQQDRGQQEPRAGAGQQDEGKRLVYEVCCIASDKIQKVRVDGKEKKVIDAKEERTTIGN